MTKAELVLSIVERLARDAEREKGNALSDDATERERAAGLSKAQAEAVVKTVLDSIVEALRNGEKVELRGFGSFRLRQRRPRQGRNPKTGTRVQVPGKSVPYFKPGKELRELLNPEGGIDETDETDGFEDGGHESSGVPKRTTSTPPPVDGLADTPPKPSRDPGY